MKTVITIIFIFLSVNIFAQKKEWEAACKENTMDSYTKFQNDFPKSSYNKKGTVDLKICDLKKLLADNEFNKIKDTNELIVLNSYLIKWETEKCNSSTAISDISNKIKVLKQQNAIEKLNAYKVGVKTITQFKEDGWNVIDISNKMDLGIISLEWDKGKGYYFFVIGTYNVDVKAWNYELEKMIFNVRRDNYNEFELSQLTDRDVGAGNLQIICSIKFENGIMSYIEFH